MESNMLSWLKDYLNSTPLEQVKKEWNEVEELGLRGPNVYEYLDFLEESYYDCTWLPPEIELEMPKKRDSEFFGVFFFATFAK
ncbi:MAG: hypothetical protein M3Q58_06820 [Bacteroidota bacterium]|nr:hypothetical protein [Bacteroidota bacterium]